MKSFFCCAVCCALFAMTLPSFAAPVPYFENFEGYAVGDTAVTNFTELASSKWTIVSPSISGKGYQDAISAFSPGVGVAAAEGSSSGISFPSLASSTFSISTNFRIDTLTLTGSDVSNTSTIGLFARGADAIPASTSSDRYQVSYYLDDDGAGHPTAKLWLREINLFFGDSLNEVSASSLPVTLGDIYKFTFTGTASGGSLALSATLTDTTTATSISVSDTDGSNLLTGSNFGYLNTVFVNAGGTTALDADFDNFSAGAPEPATAVLLLAGFAGMTVLRRRGVS